MKAIVNVTENWGIGMENRLLVTIPADLRRFRALTEGKTVILGRKTLETFPNGKPLKNRHNIIMSTDRDLTVEGAEVVCSQSDLFRLLRDVEPDAICVIGGESIYRALLPYCSEAAVTKTLCCPPADRFFPNLDKLPQWTAVSQSEILTENGQSYRFADYVNHSPLPFP